MRLHVCHQQSQFGPIFGPFLGLLLSFGGPGVISTIYEPRGVFTFRSSTLTILADSGPFRALLLAALGSQSDFHGCRIPRSAYVLVVRTRSVGQF